MNIDKRRIFSILERAKKHIGEMSDEELLKLVRETRKPYLLKYESPSEPSQPSH